MLNDLLSRLGVEGLKPVLGALVLPPVPWLLLVLAGAALLRRLRGLGWLLLLCGVCAIWLGSSEAVSDLLRERMLGRLQALGPAQIAQLTTGQEQGPQSRATTAIVVLGGGRERDAPEYDAPNLRPLAVERLRYGLWLARRTGLPVAYSGGVGHAQDDGPSEAQIASRIAAQQFGQPLRWLEDRSRDTRENAQRSIALLRRDGISRIVLVTHGWHMRRSLRAFEQAARAAGADMQIVPAPMGMATHQQRALLRWLPSSDGFVHTREVLREYLGLLAGA